MKFSVLILLSFISNVFGQGLLAPPNGKVYLGAWLDTANLGPTTTGDRPVAFNDRMALKSSAFHYAQDMPIKTFPAPDEQIKATGTDAFMLLTVYPSLTISDADITALANQCKRLNIDEKRRLLIRLAPEMNGNWFVYGQRPVAYKQMWVRIATAIRANCPLTGLVWGPNSSNGYPFRAEFPEIANTDEFRALDTNNDGQITAADDPYAPYYPGDEWVDWVGMSVYHFGATFPWLDNIEAPPGKFETLLNQGNFYQAYSVAKNKPLQITEGAAAFHTNTPRGPGAGELNVKRSWWRQWLTNKTFIETHPQIKMFNLFEFRKDEEATNRDFRITTDNAIREAFLEDLNAVKDMYLFGNVTGEVNRNDVGNPNTSGVSSVQASSLLPLVCLFAMTMFS